MMAIENIQNEIINIGIELPKLKEYSPDYLFTAMCAKFFFYEGHYSYKDFKEGFVDGRNDGGIDLIYLDDSELQPSLVLCQGKNHSSLNNKQDVVDIFTKMSQTVNNFKSGNIAGYNSKLKRIFTERYDLIQDRNPKIQLILFISVDIDDQRRREITTFVSNVEELMDFECVVYDGEQICSQIEIIKNPQAYVVDGAIKFSKEDGHLKYGEDGLLVNVYANSLRDVYNKYKDSGLFAQNFRYFVKNKKIDDSVIKSLQKKRQEFWFLNNGIIIGCKDWIVDGDKIRLDNFSIINGCQTTTLIGEYDGSNQSEDFKIPCKIIKSESRRDTFIAEIAEASNSQKPILDRDLKSNYPEQIKLRTLLENHKDAIYLEIKRGQESPKKKGKEQWQFVKNDLLGQLYLSFIYQQPGTARSNKSKIFSDIDTYNKLFKRTHSPEMVVDLLKTYEAYGKYQNEKAKNGDMDLDEESVLLNSDKIMMALVGFLIKMKRKLIDVRKLQDQEKWALEISNDDITGSFLNESTEDFEEKLNSLFSYLNLQLHTIYKSSDDKTVSNFFKTDHKYREKVLRYLARLNFDNDYLRKHFDNSYLSIFK